MGSLLGGGCGAGELVGLGGGAAQNAPVHIWAQVFAAHGMFGLALNGGAVVSGNATRAREPEIDRLDGYANLVSQFLGAANGFNCVSDMSHAPYSTTVDYRINKCFSTFV